MSDQGKQVLQQALALAPEERLRVAEELLSSLDSDAQQRIDAHWAAEAEGRIKAFDRGEIEAFPFQSMECSMETVTVSPKFQVVIPRSVRESLRIRPGQKMQVILYGKCIELVL